MSGKPDQQDVPGKVDKVTDPISELDDAPDPDEDDLDDLDDMLEEFSNTKEPASASTTTSGPGRPAPSTSSASTSAPQASLNPNEPLEELDGLSEEEFQKELEANMEKLFKDFEASPDVEAQFDNIFKGLTGDSKEGSGSSKTPISESTKKEIEDLSQDASFQDTIRRTMAKMQESGDQATAAAKAEPSEEDFIAEIMKAMKDMKDTDGGNEDDLSKMLMGMMEQLTNKDILYEPMKELNDKYPEWLEKNKDTLAKDDLKRYQEQQVLVSEMVAKFEEPTYADSNVAAREYVVDRMQKMQAAGSPPQDLVGNMPSAKEVLDAPDESCAPQ